MSIRPIDFNGMIQNTGNVSQTKAAEDLRPELQQAALTVQGQKEETHQNTSVHSAEDSRSNFFDPEEGGDGRGYTGNQGQRRDKHENKESTHKDGIVMKGTHASFDITI